MVIAPQAEDARWAWAQFKALLASRREAGDDPELAIGLYLRVAADVMGSADTPERRACLVLAGLHYAYFGGLLNNPRALTEVPDVDAFDGALDLLMEHWASTSFPSLD